MPNINTVSIPYPLNLNAQIREVAVNALFHLLPVNFTWLDHDGNLIACNQRVLDLFDVQDINLIRGKSAKELTSSMVWENTQKVLQTGWSIICEETHTKSNGETLHFLSMKTAVKTPEGKITGLVNMAVDITDRKMLELDLINAKRAAKIDEWSTI